MSWRERYKNHEARFDSYVKAFQYKNKLSRQAISMGSEAMFVDGMNDLDGFGTDEEEENQRPRGKKVPVSIRIRKTKPLVRQGPNPDLSAKVW